MKAYFQHKLSNLISVSKIIAIHYLEVDKDFRTCGESHDFWEMVYAARERVVCTADGRQIELEEGEIIFHKPNEHHSFATDGVNAPGIFVVCFACRSDSIKFFENKKFTLTSHLEGFIYSILEEGRRTFDIPYSDPNMKKMELRQHPTLGGEQLIKNYLEIFLIDLLREQTETAQGNDTFLPFRELSVKPIEDVSALLKKRIYSSVSIDDICRETAYSRAYLFRIFKEKTGKTIMRYYLELKIEESKRLLRENELTVREISDKLGFNTPEYFTKSFKRVTGFTPLVYKKKSANL